MIRIAGGELRGRRLTVPAGIRPTAEKVRKAAFDIVGQAIAGARVLDAAAGSGAYGLEALSRGAAEAVFVEADARSRRALAANLEALRLAGRATVVPARIDEFVARRNPGDEPFDVVFHDPPYAADSADDVGRLLLLLAPEGLLFHERGDDPAPVPSGTSIPDVRRYGSTRLLVYRRPC